MKRWTKCKSWLASSVIISNLFWGNIILAEECDDIAEVLRKSELQASSNSKLSDHRLEQLALMSKEVESKREKYARALGLYLEKIGADKDVDQNRIDYEKAQIKLGDFWHRTKDVLAILKKQEHLAQIWKKTALENSNKPANSEASSICKDPVSATTSPVKKAINQPVAKEIENSLKKAP